MFNFYVVFGVVLFFAAVGVAVHVYLGKKDDEERRRGAGG